MQHHQFPRFHHDGILHVALIFTLFTVSCNLDLAQIYRTDPATLIETCGPTPAAYFKHGLVYFFARNPLESERGKVQYE